jgi:hypothetical protein
MESWLKETTFCNFKQRRMQQLDLFNQLDYKSELAASSHENVIVLINYSTIELLKLNFLNVN